MVTESASVHGMRRPKILSHMEIKEGEDGGHIVSHHFEHYDHPAEHYPFGEGEGREMLTHVAKHMGVKVEHSKPEIKGKEPKNGEPKDEDEGEMD